MQGLEFVGLILFMAGVVFVYWPIAIAGIAIMVFTFAVEKLSNR